MDLQSLLQQTVGDAYTLERELAGGGMARVFVAHDRTLDRRVVIKTLSADVAVAVNTERFRREIRLAASLQQANIVPVHSTGEVGGLPYYTMPFVEGESLRAHLVKRGALPVREAVGILRDVARALAFAHERGVVHRDIKPENVLLSGSTAVVTDFGIAKAIEASHAGGASATLTQLGTALGTPAYISPEQAAGGADVDHRADLYALGVMAYELLAGEPPFTGRSAQGLMAAHISERAPALSARCPDAPRPLAALIMRCLEKEPGQRPQSAAEVLELLESAVTPHGALVAEPAREGKPSIAVLPFANLSPDPADGFFADGLTDELITDLSAIRTLRVIARAAMMRFKGSPHAPASVARELNVRYVLDGSVRRAGDSLRLTARLIDATDDSVVWSDKLSGVVDDVFVMQERVSRTIVNALQLTLSPAEERRLAKRPIDDLRAYEAYLQARQAAWSFSPDSLGSALHLLETARARIGDHPRLIAAIGGVHLNFVESGQGEAKPHLEAVARCVAQLAVSDADSVSRYALTGALHWRRGEIREAIAALSHALELEPNSPDVAIYLAYAFLLAGQDAKAREVAQLCVQLDPLTPPFMCMPGFCEIMAGNPEAALPFYRRFFDADPANPIAHYFLLTAHAEAEDLPAAAVVADGLARRFPGTVFGAVGEAYAREIVRPIGERRVTVTAEMRTQSANSDAFARPLAILLTQLNAADAAMDALDDSLRLGLTHYPYLARNSRVFAVLRDQPRFQRLLEVTRLRWERGGTSAEDQAPAPASPGPVVEERRSVAVLPFANLSPDSENEFFADGITDDLISQVAKVGELRVISRTSVMRFKGADVPRRQIGKELGVSAIVEGTVRRAGARVRVVATLVDLARDDHLWSETYDRQLDDVFAVQSDIALNIALALQAKLSAGDRQRLAAKPTTDAAAYDLYLLGRHHWNRRTDESIRRSIAYFEQALARDPAYAAAHAGMADAYLFAGLGYASIRREEAFVKARDAAAKAVALDPAMPDGLCALGFTALFRDWNVAGARDAFERAVALNPNHALAHQWLAWTHFCVGEYLVAVQVQERALALDPLNFTLVAESGWAYSYAGLHDLARERYLRALELEPGFGLARYNVGMTYQGQQRYAEAIAEYEQAVALMGGTPWVVAQLATAHLAAGDRDTATTLLEQLRAQSRAGTDGQLPIALVLDAMGMTEQALDALERAFVDREPFVFILATEGWLTLANSRPLPRFQALLRKIGLPPHDVVAQRALLAAHAARLHSS